MIVHCDKCKRPIPGIPEDFDMLGGGILCCVCASEPNNKNKKKLSSILSSLTRYLESFCRESIQ
jgi:hypothetical protein